MCIHLTTKPRQDGTGTTSATCAIKKQNSVSECSLCINRKYNAKTNRSGLTNHECQFYHYGIETKNPDFIKYCPRFEKRNN